MAKTRQKDALDATTGSVKRPSAKQLMDEFGLNSDDMTTAERRSAISGYDMRHRIEAMVAGITAKKIRHVYKGDGAATAPGFMILPRIPATHLFPMRHVRVLLGYTAHEISHQLKTDFGLLNAMIADTTRTNRQKQQIKEFWNAIEDYRIEKLVRREYPGFHVYIDDTRDFSAERFCERVDAGHVDTKSLANPYRIGAVALTWIGAELNAYKTGKPREALNRLDADLLAWLETWRSDMAAVETCVDTRDLAIIIVEELDRLREREPEDEEAGNSGGQQQKSGQQQPGQSNQQQQNGQCGQQGNQSGGQSGGQAGDGDGDGAGDDASGGSSDDTGASNGASDDDGTDQAGNQDGGQSGNGGDQPGGKDESDGPEDVADGAGGSGDDGQDQDGGPGDSGAGGETESDADVDGGGDGGGGPADQTDGADKPTKADAPGDDGDPEESQKRPDLDVKQGDELEAAEAADLEIDDLSRAIRSIKGPEAIDPDVKEGDQTSSPGRGSSGGRADEIVQQHVERGQQAYAKMRQDISGAAARSAGILRRMLMSQTRRTWRGGREEGDLDFGRLVPMVQGLPDVYKQRVDRSGVNTALTLLLDNSGSMTGHPIQVCQQTAIVLDMAIQGTPTKIEIVGFTGSAQKPVLYRYRSFGQSGQMASSSLGNMDQVDLLCTPVSTPLLEAWRRLSQQKEPRRIMIVVSDGGADWDDVAAAKQAHDFIVSQGCRVIGIAIGCIDAMTQWCENCQAIESIDDLPVALTKLVQEAMR